MTFRSFHEDDYEAVCDFLIALNREGRPYINWNWARFEWMYEHPEFNKSLLSSIGLWWSGEKVAGAAIYDMFFGEAFCAVLPDYEDLYPEVLEYAWNTLKDENGLGIALCDDAFQAIRTAEAMGFVHSEHAETVMRIGLDTLVSSGLPEGFTFAEPDPVREAEAMQWLFWQGFDHGNDYEEFRRGEILVPRPRKHFNPHLGLAAVSPTGEYTACCIVWYHPETDYAYVEPVCTVPEWRGRGIASALLTEALRRAKKLGAKEAFVISELPFYERVGFRRYRHFSFYWKKE